MKNSTLRVGLQLGVLKIPVQERPVFLTRDFGKLKKSVVYVRRGSSTAEADLDEILKMRAGPATPSLDLQLADVKGRNPLGPEVRLVSEVVDYDRSQIPVLNFSVFEAAFINSNKNFKKDKAVYIATTALLNPQSLENRILMSFE